MVYSPPSIISLPSPPPFPAISSFVLLFVPLLITVCPYIPLVINSISLPPSFPSPYTSPPLSLYISICTSLPLFSLSVFCLALLPCSSLSLSIPVSPPFCASACASWSLSPPVTSSVFLPPLCLPSHPPFPLPLCHSLGCFLLLFLPLRLLSLSLYIFSIPMSLLSVSPSPVPSPFLCPSTSLSSSMSSLCLHRCLPFFSISYICLSPFAYVLPSASVLPSAFPVVFCLPHCLPFFSIPYICLSPSTYVYPSASPFVFPS